MAVAEPHSVSHADSVSGVPIDEGGVVVVIEEWEELELEEFEVVVWSVVFEEEEVVLVDVVDSWALSWLMINCLVLELLLEFMFILTFSSFALYFIKLLSLEFGSDGSL